MRLHIPIIFLNKIKTWGEIHKLNVSIQHEENCLLSNFKKSGTKILILSSSVTFLRLLKSSSRRKSLVINRFYFMYI